MPRILIVDDERDVRAMMSIVLRVRHFEVTEAATAAAGLKAFEGTSFDAAIVDVFLADASGFDLIAAMRERAPNLPVVAVSGIATVDLASPAAGMSNVVSLQKPFRPNDLIAAVERARASAAPAVGA